MCYKINIMNIALFDLDNTLINGDSDYEWGNFLVENNYVDPEYYKKKNDIFFEQYRNGTLCPKEFAKFSYEPLKKYNIKFLLEIREIFFEKKIKPIIRSKAEDLIKLHAFTGELSGEPCFKEGKVKKVKEWIKLNKYIDIDEMYFYTDSHNDIELLEFCTIPVAVDPDNTLREISIKNNWKIISLKL